MKSKIFKMQINWGFLQLTYPEWFVKSQFYLYFNIGYFYLRLFYCCITIYYFYRTIQVVHEQHQSSYPMSWKIKERIQLGYCFLYISKHFLKETIIVINVKKIWFHPTNLDIIWLHEKQSDFSAKKTEYGGQLTMYQIHFLCLYFSIAYIPDAFHDKENVGGLFDNIIQNFILMLYPLGLCWPFISSTRI